MPFKVNVSTRHCRFQTRKVQSVKNEVFNLKRSPLASLQLIQYSKNIKSGILVSFHVISGISKFIVMSESVEISFDLSYGDKPRAVNIYPRDSKWSQLSSCQCSHPTLLLPSTRYHPVSPLSFRKLLCEYFSLDVRTVFDLIGFNRLSNI